jgi:hypothetical protein
MPRFHRLHQAAHYPAIDDLAFGFDPGANLILQVIPAMRCSMQDLVGENLRGIRTTARGINFRDDVSGESLGGIGIGADLVARGQPLLEDALDQPAIQRFLGAEVIVEIGLRQPGALSDGGGGRAE